jgi:hypothetical protein
MGAQTFEAQGNVGSPNRLASIMVDCDPRFEIMPGTKARGAEVEPATPFTVEVGGPVAGQTTLAGNGRALGVGARPAPPRSRRGPRTPRWLDFAH